MRQLSEQERIEDSTRHVDNDRASGLNGCGVAQEWARGKIRDDFGPPTSYGEALRGTTLVATGPGPVRGGRTHEDRFYDRRSRQNL